MFQATRAIYQELKKNPDLKVFTDENEKHSDVWLQFGIKSGGNYRIRFISKDDDNDVAVRVYSLINVNREQLPQILLTVNDLNCAYRYARFSCDKDGDVNVEYDFPVSCDHPEKSAMEIVIRFVQIIESAYPKLMRALWG